MGSSLTTATAISGFAIAANGRERLIAGQSWLLCQEIGHGLQLPLNIGRTSSQDTGVTPNADVIVATASLEVGFNDPEVGDVIQHKAPRDMASFLQRKGRAGRRRTMRPWTVVVLSDYGRDRIAYQGYDILFNPVLEKRSHLMLTSASTMARNLIRQFASPRDKMVVQQLWDLPNLLTV
ncbi:helicase-related protein [Mastigocladopsis repens]|uniref:helicase-related protein n=1 Tax=Mastigocladopsis repens TaxID=221287 RepID=UPI0004745DE2|nr:helicase-related protein [Mastigocladopsis repens]